jgi:TPR repeat protein
MRAISFASAAADAELQDLARRARAGDPRAQLDLGIRYEEGIRLPVNRAHARKLYLAAARDSVTGKRGGAEAVLR